MSHAAVYSRAQLGIEAPLVTVETHLTSGLPGFTLVGLPATSVREARDRVRSAITNSGFRFPKGKVIVNLAPGDLAKEGPRYDLAIAASLLCATGQLRNAFAERYEFLGELSLDGSVRSIRGSLCAAITVRSERQRTLVLPECSAEEDPAIGCEAVLRLAHLKDLPALLKEFSALAAAGTSIESKTKPTTSRSSEPARAGSGTPPTTKHFDQVIGQQLAKRTLTLAAAGGHHLLFVGPPGSGKTLLAKALAELLPALEPPEQERVACIYSAAGLKGPGPRPPLREPHHSISPSAFIGGGPRAVPGEMTLAQHGVLFLDELPHYARNVLELLREPLSSGSIQIARASYRVQFPAEFQVIAAMNPCPVGDRCEPATCRCGPQEVRRYQSRISGPLLDRIDLQLAVAPVDSEKLLALALGRDHQVANMATTGAAVQLKVQAARRRQLDRQGHLNGALAGDKAGLLPLAQDSEEVLESMLARQPLSARACTRLLRVATTIADLKAEPEIGAEALAEAFSYRQLSWASASFSGGP